MFGTSWHRMQNTRDQETFVEKIFIIFIFLYLLIDFVMQMFKIQKPWVIV